MINITFHGAARTVTGSRHLLDINGYRILLDCGLFQGRRSETYERNLHFPFNVREIRTVLLSHAHMDHLGNIPNLVKQGFSGDIHCTAATFDLANVMLMDAANIQQSDTKFVNKIRRKHNEGEIEPLYTINDIPPALKLFDGHSYDHSFSLSDDINIMFRDAGHILGSAITILNINDNGRKLKVCFTGDLGRYNMPIIQDPYVVSDADILIIEST
ncbi:MAG: MBL fold metallo-hydrolase, partial [Chloroflexi bacterium]|nr:MBL fold metallo-hydrolase [Chloroflexota bacterium]